MDAETHNIPPGEKNKKLCSKDQVVGRQRPAHHHEYCSDIVGVVFNNSSHPEDFGCGSDCMSA
jgi:hypothetical protein